MKKALTLFVAALLSMGTLMAQTAKMNQRLEAQPTKGQATWNTPQSMAKDAYCTWNDNLNGNSSAYYWKQDHTNSIYNWAEKFTNNAAITIDSFGFVPYIVNGTSTSSVTVTVYGADASGAPGTALGTKTLSYSDVTALTENHFAFNSPIAVTGDYFIAFALNSTPATDTFALLTTGIRSDNVNTAWCQYSGTWYGIGTLFTSNGSALNCSFLIYSHTCTADLQGTYTVTANANNSAWGTVTGGGSYNAGTTCTLTATPNAGYRFICWQDSVTDNPRSFPVLADAAYTAIFAAEPNCSYTLPYTCGFETADEVYCWTSVDGDGDSYGWDWGESTTLGHTGTHYMYSGSYLNSVGPLEPSNWLISPELNIPAGGAVLTYWIAPQDQNYPDDYYELVLSPTGSTDTTSFTVTLLTETLTAADYGYTQRTVQITQEGIVRFAFHHMNSYDVYIINLDDISVVANNPTESYTITVNVDNPDHGSASGSGTYYAGQQVTLTATPASGYAFLQWNDGNMQNPRTITVTGDATYTATFAQDDTPEYTITLLAAVVRTTDTLFLIEEEADWSGAGTFTEGSHTTLSVTPKGEFAGVQFLGWQDGNTSMPRTVTVTEDKTYTAYFKDNSTQGIDQVNGAEVIRTEYYDVLGRQLTTEPAHGIFLIRTITTDGQTTRKVMKL